MTNILQRFSILAVFSVFAAMAGCQVSPDISDDRGRTSELDDDRQDIFSGSCEDSCGGKAAAGCWCNTQCVEFNDCCPDYQAVCNGQDDAPESSCRGVCGRQAPGGCYCDTACREYGDCCEDYGPECLNEPDPDPDPDPDPTPTDPWSDLSNTSLENALHDYTRSGHAGKSYNTARNHMYGVGSGIGFDIHGGVIECIYTGRTAEPDGTRFPDSLINTEHSWPQSDGAGSSPAQGDLHHLFPSYSVANSRRSSFQFGETECVGTECTWAESGSELGPDASGQTVFQVRPEYRGDIARAHFYFSVRYERSIPNDEETVLKAWNTQDPPSERERERNDAIEGIQNNRNPFVDYPSMANRIDDF